MENSWTEDQIAEVREVLTLFDKNEDSTIATSDIDSFLES